ncbi:AsnC family transcriptional regulator [Actinoplanes sp. NPDC051470]|uniref:Lrp/AsnC family transcriptional regulator n=1 Tax=unclassified Actinoplanes TaxID=2626549 RepID=UPI003438F76B
MAFDSLERLDQQILAALQVDGRAQFRRIAEVLGTSDQTVARRYRRLRSTGQARVLGLTDLSRLGETQWFIRARTTPDAAVAIGEGLSRRPDTTWVYLTSGGTEIVCSTSTRDLRDSNTLLQRLPRSQRIVDVSAHARLHVFFGLASSPLLKAGLLTDEQMRALAPPAAGPGPAGPVSLDDLDRALLRLLAEDGRHPVEWLADRAKAPATTVRRRIEALRADGVLYLDVDIDQRPGAGTVPTLMWLTVTPAAVAEVGAALAAQPEVAYAAATTGRTNIFVSLRSGDAGELYRYLTGPVADLPGVTAIETAPVIRNFKGAG